MSDVERKAFERAFPVPKGIYWSEISEQYDALPGAAGFYDVEIYHGQWMGWQAARAQSGQGVEPVAWSWGYRGLHVSTDKAFVEKIAADGFAVRPLVFADTQPAQQSNQEDVIALLTNALANIRDTNASAKTLQSMAALALGAAEEVGDE